MTAVQRANLAWANRPPGPQALWYALGSGLRAVGQAMDKMGIALEGDAACIEKLPIPTTAVKVGGKAPSIGEASFVAPSANLLGAVTLAPGASAWCGGTVANVAAAVPGATRRRTRSGGLQQHLT